MKRNLLFFILFGIGVLSASAQEEPSVPPQEIPSQNLLRYNRFFVNPTFSRVGLTNSYISLFNRNQWVEFDDSPKLYMLNYASRVNEQIGVGLGVYQQTNGVLSYFGVNANYSYGVQFSEKSWLTFGANLSYFQSGLKSGVNTENEDPAIQNFDETSLFTFKPGINLTLGSFDVGVYAENLVGYDIKNNEALDSDKTYSAHLMYTSRFGEGDEMMLRPMVRARQNEEGDLDLTGNLLFDMDKLGWAQVGYNDFYGGSLGLGIHVTKNISIGYTIEKGFSDRLSNLGATHEITLAYRFRDLSDKVADQRKLDSLNTALAKKDKELESVKDQMETNVVVLNDVLKKQDSINKANLKRSENQYKQIVGLLKTREALGRTNNTTVALTQTRTNQKVASEGQQVKRTVASNYRGTTGTKNKMRSNRAAPKFASKTLDAYKPGFYLVGNVYKQFDFANRYNSTLLNEGYSDATVISNNSNNYKYVTLRSYGTRAEAEAAYYQDVDGRFTNPMWILEIKNTNSDAFVSNSKPTKDVIVSNTRKSPSLRQQNKDDVSTSKSAVVEAAFSQAERGEPETTTTQKSETKKPKPDSGVSQNNTARTKPGSDTSQGNSSKPEVLKSPKSTTKRALAKNEKSGELKKGDRQIPKKQAAKSPKENTKPNQTRSKRMVAPKSASKNLTGYESGSYLICAVFKNAYNADDYVKTLKNRGFDESQIIHNPKNGFYYTALENSGSQEQAIGRFYSNMDDRYFEPLWILNISEVGETQLIAEEPKKTRARDKRIKQTLEVSQTSGEKPGYYLVANVFSTEHYYNKFITILEQKNLDPKSFKNTSNDYNYVYLKRFDDVEKAKESYYSKINNTYNDDLWILEIE